MKKILSVIFKIILCYVGLMLICGGIGGIIACTKVENILMAALCIIFSILLFISGFFLFRAALKKEHTGNQIVTNKEKENPEKNDEKEISEAYVDTGNTIYRTDGEDISDEEIPYLIQSTYEETMRDNGISNYEPLDLSFIQVQNKNKKTFTRIPSFEELSHIEPENPPINSTDIFFLKYINGLTLENPFIAQYWYYDYNLNYSEEIRKLVSAGLLTVSNVNIEKFKVNDLKAILRNFNLPLTGNKKDLQQRLIANVSTEALSDFLGTQTQYFCATEKGKSLINNICESATKNLELEDACINLIRKYKFDEAFSLIDNFKRSVPAGAEASSFFTPNMNNHYYEIMDSNCFYYTLEKDRDIEDQVRAAIIFCRMYGSSQENIIKIIKRVYNDNHRIFCEDARNILRGRLL